MDFKLVNMKMSKAETEKVTEASAPAVESPRYPWGLSLNLDDEILGKLGIKDLPDVDKGMMLAARVTVTRASSTAMAGDKKRRSLELQITDLGLGDEPAKHDPAEKIYGK